MVNLGMEAQGGTVEALGLRQGDTARNLRVCACASVGASSFEGGHGPAGGDYNWS